MKIRWLSLALFALVLGTAFAPAPFNRVRREKRPLLTRFLGTWKIEKKERMGPNNEVSTMSTSQRVVIEDGTWRFSSSTEGKAKGGKAGKGPKGGQGGFGGKGKGLSRRYDLVLIPNTFPQGFRLLRGTRDQEEYMVGILTIEGDTAKILYRLAQSDDTLQKYPPADFDTIPEAWYRLTLHREK